MQTLLAKITHFNSNMLKFLYMGRSIKQIYVSLQINENEIQILVSEYFNTRFNVLRVDRKQTNAVADFRIVDQKQLIEDIKSLVSACSEKIGAKIEQCILVLPAYNFKRFPLRSSVVPDNGLLSKKDIARAISNSLKAKVDYNVTVASTLVNKYIINGIASRRIPEREACDEALIDIDLLCVDKDMTYDYVSIVESAGLKVLDITINSYANGKEASLLEESLKQNVICLDIGRNCTYLSLFNKGRLVSSEVVFDGLDRIVTEIRLKYDIPENDILKLVKYEVSTSTDYEDDIVYAYSFNRETISITKKELNKLALRPINDLVDKFISMCKPIIEQGASLFITGEGQQVYSMVKELRRVSNCDTKSYYPDTIGVRDPSLTSLYGALFVYKDKAQLNDLNVSCIDLLEFESKISDMKFDTEGETITTKIKNLFKQYVEKGEE